MSLSSGSTIETTLLTMASQVVCLTSGESKDGVGPTWILWGNFTSYKYSSKMALSHVVWCIVFTLQRLELNLPYSHNKWVQYVIKVHLL